jgi:RIO-like serine/threonine protein kinase
MNHQLIEVIKDKSILTPVVKLIEYKGRKVISKDYSNRPFWVKKGWGEILINNEFNILKRLKGIKGIPHPITRTTNGFIVEYISGKFLNKFPEGTIPYEIIIKLHNLISDMHNHYVVHLDLAQRKNILITDDYTPYIIDFANALYLRPKTIFSRELFDYLCLIDKGSLLKFKNRYFPDKMTVDDKRFLKRFWTIRRWWFFSPKTFRSRDRV